MAAASSRLFLLLCLCYGCSIHVRVATSLSFDIDFTLPIANLTALIRCEGDASFMSHDVSPSMLELTQAGQRDNAGRASYVKPVPLWDNVTGEMASFNTTFSFEITNPGRYTGDGMTFFLAKFASLMPLRSAGGNLGLVAAPNTSFDAAAPNTSFNVAAPNTSFNTDDPRFVAVEFDTYRNRGTNDPSGNHIGVDINSVNSTSFTDTTNPTWNLTSGFTMVATVKYDNRTKLLAVALQINNKMYYVEASVDLSKVLPPEVAVGFTAATGSNFEQHRVLSWSFSSTLEPRKPAMAPAPAPTISDPKPKHPSNVGILLSILVPTSFLLACAAVAFLLWRRRVHRASESDAQRRERAELELGVIAGGPRRYKYRELAAATNNFAEEGKLGRGGFGNVYRGRLTMGEQDDRPVAIKMLSQESSAQGRKEFEAEVRIISRLSHGNLVRLLGWSDSRDGLLLVYELVAEGTLEKHLHDSERLLTWPERYKIILGLGSSLCYLHGEWHQCVIHGDIKPSNIMLDSSYNTKLGDFGLARLVDHGVEGKTTYQVAGTVGYLDPAFLHTFRRSTESDVYSFGVVLLEIVSGRRPQLATFVLRDWVLSLHGGNDIVGAVDERLRGDELEEWWMERVLCVGLWCTQRDQSDRPSIAQAMDVLKSKDARPPVLSPDLAVASSSAALLGEISRTI